MSIRKSSQKITLKFVLLQITFIVCLIMTGVSLPALAQSTGSHDEGEMGRTADSKENKSQPVQDAWIRGKLEGVYLFNEHLSPFSIDTEVKDGVVNLTGTVESDIDKELAGEIAKGIDGVREVNNDLAVEVGVQKQDGIAEKGQKGGAESDNNFVRWVDDATITAIVKSKLLANGEVSGMSIDVETRDNLVTLSGEVESDEARQLAEEIAGNTEDVAEVKNNLRVEGRVADIE